MFYILYETTNLINNKKYRGVHQTKNLDDGYIGSGKYLHRAIEKYGIQNFKRKILAYAKSTKELYQLEKEYVNQDWIKRKDSYNLKIGGRGGWEHIDQKIRQKITNKRNYKDEEYLKKARENTKRAIKEKRLILKPFPKGKLNYDWTGKIHSEETKKKISEANKKLIGSKNSQYGTMWITNGLENKKIKKVDNIPDGWYKGRKINIVKTNE